LSTIIPACAITCLGCNDAFAVAFYGEKPADEQDVHDFQKELTITYKRLFDYRYKSNFIPVFRAMQEDVGKDKVLEMIKAASSKNNRDLGQRIAERREDNSFSAFAEPFRNPRGVFKHANIYDIVEDTDIAFEMRFSECLTATVFREADAADIGYAAVCHADFALPGGFNPGIELVRDKTLMEGHDCCNHRYVYKG
jgi:hypothetical protein